MKACKIITIIILTIFTVECSNSHVYKYSYEELFPKKYTDSLALDKSSKFFKFEFKSIYKSKWDSILLLKPYINARIVKRLDIDNYSAISDAIENQAFQEGTCTLVFVSRGRYVAYAVLARNFVDFSDTTTGEKTQYVWLTRKNCGNLYLKKQSTRAGIYYRVEYKSATMNGFG